VSVVPHFLAESSVSPTSDAFERACQQASRLADDDAQIAYLRTTFLPGGVAVLHLFDAPSVAALATAGERAGLPFTSIVETAVTATSEERTRQ
jgi:hypothetical protein